MGNFGDVFCSKIPPSKINFRAWVPEYDDTIMGSFRSEISDRDFLGSADKFDIETGKFGKDGGGGGVLGLPTILQHLDYGTDVDDDNPKKEVIKDRDAYDEFNSSFSPIGHQEQQKEWQKNLLSVGSVNNIDDRRTL